MPSLCSLAYPSLTDQWRRGVVAMPGRRPGIVGSAILPSRAKAWWWRQASMLVRPIQVGRAVICRRPSPIPFMLEDIKSWRVACRF